MQKRYKKKTLTSGKKLYSMEDINDQCPHFLTDSIADDINSSDVVQGETYLIYSSNGTILDGMVAHCREVSYPEKNSRDPQLHLQTEYYVHYIDQNARLDEWVSPNQILGHRPSLGQYTSTPEKSSATTTPINRQIKQIDKLCFGNFEIDTWYHSPYPEEFADLSRIYVCQYCLKYMQKPRYSNHRRVCARRQPPGQVIYRKGIISIYEIDGHTDKLYCQLLSLLGKLFIEHKHKTICYDVGMFSFYVLCKINQNGAEFIGYFSKEKRSRDDNNLACLAVLPPFQRCGYGRFLVEFSYELSKLECKITGPERPLSDLAHATFSSYWTHTLVNLLNEMSVSQSAVTVKNLSRLSCIAETDIVNTLEKMEMIKFWNGETIICATREKVGEHVRTMKRKHFQVFDPVYLKWNVPYHNSEV